MANNKHLNRITCKSRIYNNSATLLWILVGTLSFHSHVSAALPNGAIMSIGGNSNFRMGGCAAPATTLVGENGIEIGSAPGDTGTGSHGGPPLPTDIGAVTQPWSFFNATGYDFILTTPVTEPSPGNLDFRGWTVTWNGIPAIPMGGCSLVVGGCDTDGDGIDEFSDTGIATFTWSGVSGDPYTLDYLSHVPAGDPSNFGGVEYCLRLEGIITLPGTPPNAQPDSANTIIGNPVVIDVLANDLVGNEGFDLDSVLVVTPATNGTTDDTNPNGTISYSPNTAPDFIGIDSFEYTVDSNFGITSAPAQVSVDVQANVAPVAIDDSLAASTATLDNAGGSLIVSVLSNDTDTNNAQNLPGGIDTSSVTITSQAGFTVGSCSANADGTITYSQPAMAVAESGTCTYQVSDIDTVNPPLTASADLNITISALQSDWDSNLDLSTIIPILVFDPGVPNASGNTADIPQSGTYFSMDVSQATTIYTTLTPGNSGGMIIGHDQIAASSHTSVPNGSEVTSIDMPWAFFGNTGMSFSKNGGIAPNPSVAGTLQFSGDPAVNNGQGRYQITWNGIPEIDLGGSPDFPEDLGFGTINCSATAPVDPADTNLCAHGDAFELLYDAHVPLGDPSGFGGVQYGLRMTGTVQFMDSALQASNGTISTETRTSATALANADAGTVTQCIGDCFDYTITGVTNPSVSVVLPLASTVPAGYVDGQGTTVSPVMRVFNGTWADFDTSGGDSVQSAAVVAGGAGLTCPPPGDAAYGALTAGHQCVQVTIADNGLNDKDPAVGTITDPSGIGLPVGAAFVDTRTSSSSGCSIATGSNGIWQSGAWGLLAGFIALLGWRRRTARQL